MGEPVMAWGAPSHYSLTPFTGSLCQAFCLTRQRLSLSVAMFHYYDRSDRKRDLGRNLLRQGPKPSVNVASHLVFGNAVAFLDFAF